jgi:hypothetical protein
MLRHTSLYATGKGNMRNLSKSHITGAHHLFNLCHLCAVVEGNVFSFSKSYGAVAHNVHEVCKYYVMYNLHILCIIAHIYI